MAIARFKDLCIDANDPAVLGPFWARVLGQQWEPEAGSERIVGTTPQHTIWLCTVPEGKTVKHRVHLDISATDLTDLTDLGELGSKTAVGWPEHLPWTVMTDPEGGEYCAFLRPELPVERLHGLVVDSVDPPAQARWWAGVYDARVLDDPLGCSTVTDIPGMPILTMDFVPVPEAKTVKNRVHWDVDVDDLAPLMNAGAVVLRPEGGDIRWHVMADPEGNELCAFVTPVEP